MMSDTNAVCVAFAFAFCVKTRWALWHIKYHQFFPTSKQIISVKKKWNFFSTCLWRQRQMFEWNLGYLIVTQLHFKKTEDNYKAKSIFCNGDFPEDTFGEEWTRCLTCDDWGQEECFEVRNKFHSVCDIFLQSIYGKVRPQLWKYSKIKQKCKV